MKSMAAEVDEFSGQCGHRLSIGKALRGDYCQGEQMNGHDSKGASVHACSNRRGEK
jgi:hypothetical protein